MSVDNERQEGAREEGARVWRVRELRCQCQVCGWRVHVPTSEAAHLDGKRDVRLRVAARTRRGVDDLHPATSL